MKARPGSRIARLRQGSALGVLMLMAALGTAQAAESAVTRTEGPGEALVYPLYATQGLDSLLLLDNHLDAAIAVGVSVREGALGLPLESFIVYIRPHGSFSAAIFDFTRTGIGVGPGILLPDTTMCVFPPVGAVGTSRPGQRFALLDETAARLAGAPAGTAELGYVEAILLGAMPDPPVDIDRCFEIAEAWRDGVFSQDPGAGLVAAERALTGELFLVNVPEGESYSLPATTLSGYRRSVLAATPSTLPTVAEGSDNRLARVAAVDDGRVLAFDTPLEAVSAALAATRLRAEFPVDQSTAGDAELVITLPTYAAAVTARRLAGEPVLPPFVNAQAVSIELEAVGRDGVEATRCASNEADIGLRVRLLERAVHGLPDGESWRNGGITGARRAWLPDTLFEGAPSSYVPAVGAHGHLNVGLGPGAELRCDHGGLTGPYFLTGLDSEGRSVTVSGLPVVASVLARLRNVTLLGGTVLANYGLTPQVRRDLSLTESATRGTR